MESQVYDLICVICYFGKASKIIKYAKEYGIKGATILMGLGTVNKYLLKLLDLTEQRKEIILMAAPKDVSKTALAALNEKFQFGKPHHGIAFTLDLLDLYGVSDVAQHNLKGYNEEETHMYKALFVVVDKGRGGDVVDAAIKAGSKGATIINGRGSGIHESKFLFSMQIEPEKEVVLIISKTSLAQPIIDQIRQELKIDEPGMGILFSVPVSDTYGLYE
jgi:nitrogen regulatory protein PII